MHCTVRKDAPAALSVTCAHHTVTVRGAVPETARSRSLTEEEQPEILFSPPGFVYAPVAEGADAGYAYVLLSGKAVGKIPVVYGETIEMAPEKEKRSFFRRM